MRIYVGTYAQYNNGSLFGKWLDLSDYADRDEFYQACYELHKGEGDPELMFQDWEDIPSGMVHESGVDEGVWDLLEAFERYDDGAVKAYVDWVGSWDEGDFEERFVGHYDCFQDYAEEFFDECYSHEIPYQLRSYIDMERFARDLEYDYHEDDGYIFRNC